MTKTHESAPDRTNIGREYWDQEDLPGIPRGPDGLPPHGVPPNTPARLPNNKPPKLTTPNRVPQFASDQTSRHAHTKRPTHPETQRQTDTGETYPPIETYIRLALHG